MSGVMISSSERLAASLIRRGVPAIEVEDILYQMRQAEAEREEDEYDDSCSLSYRGWLIEMEAKDN